MKLPPLAGKLDQSDFFIYAAADSNYFDQFGRSLVTSVLRNTNYGVHVHLYDPRDDQLNFCQQPRVSASWEYCAPGQFDSAVARWSRTDLPEPDAGRRLKMLCMKQFADSDDVARWIHKTYYACMRFVRLAELVKQPQRFLEIDIDGIVRSPFITEFDDCRDFYLYKKDKGGHLAGAILYSDQQNSLKFIQELGSVIQSNIEQDNIYWFLDQHSLDQVAVNYQTGLLPISYVDWKMNPASAIWSAKGRRKELAVFKQEQQRYQ